MSLSSGIFISVCISDAKIGKLVIMDHWVLFFVEIVLLSLCHPIPHPIVAAAVISQGSKPPVPIVAALNHRPASPHAIVVPVVNQFSVIFFQVCFSALGI